MAIGTDADTDWCNRDTNIGSVGHAGITVSAWVYIPSAGQSYAQMADAGVLSVGHLSNGRALGVAFDNNFGSGTYTDSRLAITDSQTGASAFASDPPFDDWFFLYFRTDTAGGTIYAEWSSDGSTWNSHSKANGVETSVQAEALLINRMGVGNANGLIAHYAYVQAFGSDLGQTAARALYNKSASDASEWAFWPLADNTDTGDDSGNSRTLTFNGTLSSETSPTLGAAFRPKLLLLGVG